MWICTVWPRRRGGGRGGAQRLPSTSSVSRTGHRRIRDQAECRVSGLVLSTLCLARTSARVGRPLLRPVYYTPTSSPVSPLTAIITIVNKPTSILKVTQRSRAKRRQTFPGCWAGPCPFGQVLAARPISVRPFISQTLQMAKALLHMPARPTSSRCPGPTAVVKICTVCMRCIASLASYMRGKIECEARHTVITRSRRGYAMCR